MTGTEEYYSEIAQEYAREQSFQEMPEKAEKELKKLLDRFLDKVHGEKVLDAGCGAGRDTEYFRKKGYRVAGIDSASGMIETAKKHGDAEYAVMDIRKMGFEDDTFSGVWCNTVMQFLDGQGKKRAINEIARVLEPGGVLYTTFKIGGGTVTREEDGLERHLVGEKEVLKQLKNSGLEPEDYWTFELNGMTVLGAFCVRR